ncbi:probable serine/threonine-protein kinase samkC [Anopheles ziemanni]|uniref:probable serine/threonine-protein kinase samkC n=1 Tax=Anopheles coustani TaxID=139045 RepID=UPI002657B57C|nr:probable serine/threonine-protein kinase samkC [Anopheles coustani]XP_058173497.1 probable serine/threonine-protein kinase samkC [Anopheles ziemanni]
MKHSLLLLPLAGLITLATAQYGPAPPRLNIPGAIALPPIREERLLPQQPPQVIRVRRPGAVRLAAPNAIHHQQPSALPKFHDPSTAEHKPVTEEPEDDFRPAFIPQLQQPHAHPSPAPPSPAATPALQYPIPADEQANERELQQNVLSRFNAQENRPAPLQRAQIPERFFATDKEPQRFAANERPQPQPQPTPKQYRPAPQQTFRQPQQQQQHFQDEDRRPAPQAPRVHSQQEQDRKRKPVAQILRKWRDEHEDGSITWGFENDDGSFKEETIGIDCVTRGRYGYVDPDGEKREYTYETGIQCDPNQRDEDDEDNLEVDYQENKAVLPNGVRLDLNNMGKKQSKRPGGNQQSQPPQYYRN